MLLWDRHSKDGVQAPVDCDMTWCNQVIRHYSHIVTCVPCAGVAGE